MMSKYRVHYLGSDGKERRSAWFYSEDLAKQALEVFKSKGRIALIFAD